MRFSTVALLAALAPVAALVVSSPGGRDPAQAHEHASHTSTYATSSEDHGDHAAARVAFTSRQAAFHDQMRKLWEDHVTRTRLAIVTFVDGSASFDATATRLLKNQKHPGDAIKPFYGKAAGRQLTALLRDHILIAVDLLVAAKSGDTAGFDSANTRWYANSDDVADLISSLDPKVWPRATLRSMMRSHLDQTLTEAAAELGGDYTASVRAYDEIHHHIPGHGRRPERGDHAPVPGPVQGLSKMTTAFVLSGGGSPGAVRVGMLLALADEGVARDLLVGTSAGARRRRQRLRALVRLRLCASRAASHSLGCRK
ncbi:hypothetical protein [Nocardioides sp. B-3]|uniref:hypothetical protein n=1 Tax=Nocardioides sp. B-3 TaxID=2895565 RepID=UPI002153887C|nr:hypothetical protein [Nocardioides sp. B-3]UUZ59683.1 hypothetical protein LP418_00585 [Nocardioides sp. B-3]